ncbi:MAG: hypothetical protein IOC86_12470 [Aestuariivirga sp.]|nr:hypothetical protein [Aestuariivirga sp.]
MKKTISVLFATTALTAAIAIPAWSAMRAPASIPAADAVETILDTAQGTTPLILVDDDDDEKDEGPRRGGNDDDDNEDDDDEDDNDECDDDDGACGAARNPAPAGTVTPPENGLFGSGTAPKAQVN